MVRRLLVTLFALGLVAAACGDSDSSTTTDGGGDLSSEEQEALSAIEELSADDGSPFEDMSDEELKCTARGLVADDDLFRAMIDDTDFEELTADQQLNAMNLFVGCAPETLAQVIADGMAEGTSMSADDAKCLADEILNDDTMLSGMLAAGMSGAEPDASLIAGLFDMLETCDVPLSSLTG